MRIWAKRVALGASMLGLVNIDAGADEPPAKAGTVIREFDTQGFHVRVDRSRQVIAVNVPEERGFARGDAAQREEAPVAPTLSDSGAFVSASVLAQKAKQFDDGLYAAVDLAAQNGSGEFPGKSATARPAGTRPGGGG